jgi:uncharacterized protein (DUF1697 family)
LTRIIIWAGVHLTQFVAFLRAINVGGHNVVKKEKLQEIFVSLSFANVSVYKQSGNVIFETALTDTDVIQKKIQKELSKILGRDIGVFVREMSYLNKIVESNPFKDANAEGASFLIAFMSNQPSDFTLPLRIPSSRAEVILIKGCEAYSVTHGHGEGGKPNPFLESKFKTQATTRNLNILREIVRTYTKPDKQTQRIPKICLNTEKTKNKQQQCIRGGRSSYGEMFHFYPAKD